MQYLHRIFPDMVLIELSPVSSRFLLRLRPFDVSYSYTIRLQSKPDRAVQICFSMDFGELLLFIPALV